MATNPDMKSGGGNQADGLRRMSSVTPLDRKRARAIAVTGGKGGVGKSTVALNLAVSWARRGSKTLTVDGDLGMADLNLMLGLAPAHSLADVLDGVPISDVLEAAHGIDLLPALNGSHRLANLDDAARRNMLSAIDSSGHSAACRATRLPRPRPCCPRAARWPVTRSSRRTRRST